MTVRVAFIGAGGIAGWKHFDTVEAADGVDVVAICDIDEATARDAADRFDAAVYTDHHELYDRETFDAVFVCLPPFAHTDQELLAAEHGVDLFVEKPLALSTETAAEIRQAVEDAGIVTAVGYNWRYAEAVEAARDLLGDRTVSYVEGWWKGDVPDSDWWKIRERSGGQVVEQATHIYDLVRYLGGEVETVTAAGGHRLNDELDFPDTTSSTMTHENGVVSHVAATSTASTYEYGVEVIADGAQLTVTQEGVEGVVDGESVDRSFDDSPYRTEVHAFLDAVRSGDDAPIRSDYADATRSLALTLAVNEAADTGEPVQM